MNEDDFKTALMILIGFIVYAVLITENAILRERVKCLRNQLRGWNDETESD